MAATTYTTTQAVTLAQLAAAYNAIANIFLHLSFVKLQLNITIIMTAIVLNVDNTISFTFSNALPVGADQLAHLGLVQTS